MTVRRSGDGKLVFETSVNRSVLFSQTGPLRLAQFCNALFYIEKTVLLVFILVLRYDTSATLPLSSK